MAKTITHNEKGQAHWGDEDHLQIAQSRSFASLIFELLSEKVPTEAELKVFELILNLSIDHGPDTPSAVPVIEAAKAGKTISEAVAEGIEQINDVHGGAQERLMEILYNRFAKTPDSQSGDEGEVRLQSSAADSTKRLKTLKKKTAASQAAEVYRVKSQKSRVKELVEEYLREGKRLAGYGHRIYKDIDPRAQLILSTLRENGFRDEFIKIAQDLEKELETQKGSKLPLNIDGAIAVALCTFGWDPKLGKPVFIIARTPGLCAHYLNNKR